jgi:hypothetical protein
VLSAAILPAQTRRTESPRQLTGSLDFGWMDTTARETFREHRSNPFTTLRLDFQSYLLNPGFLTYRVQPRLSAGFQGGFTGVSEGSGIAFESTFLPSRPWPFHFRYSRLRRSWLTSGLGSTYARFLARNDDSILGFDWQYAVPNHPFFQISFDKVLTATLPESVLLRGFETRSRTLSLTGRDSRGGWNLDGALSLQRLDTQFPLRFEQGTMVVESKSDVRNLLFLAQRPLSEDLNFFFSFNRTGHQVEFEQGLLHQNFNTLTAKLDYQPRGRFQAWTQARFTRSDLESAAPARLGVTAFAIPPVQISNAILDSEARYRVHPYLSVFGRSEFTQVRAPLAGQVQRAGNFWNTGGGAQFFRSTKRLTLGSSYYLFTTLTRFESEFPGNLVGHAWDGSVSAGDPAVVRATGQGSVSRSREDVRNLLFSNTAADRARLELARTFFRRWTVQVYGGLAKMRFRRPELRSEFLGKDYGASLTARRYYVGYTRSSGSGDSFQQLFGVIPNVPPGSPLFLLVGSANSATGLNASWNLTSRLTMRGIWRRQSQTIGSLLASRFEQQEATLGWSFRKVRAEAGYLVYRFDFGSPVLRKMIFVRITRDFRVF